MAKIFISYRRDDSERQAHEIYNAIKKHLGGTIEEIFIDVDSIPLGVNFQEVIDAKVAECDLMLALIGRNWLTITSPETGERRLDKSDDFVRIEIASALVRGIRVVPVMLDGASTPHAAELPEELRELPFRNGIEVKWRSFEDDIKRLLSGLKLQPATQMPRRATGEYEPNENSNRLLMETSDERFEGQVIRASEDFPVIVLFWAPWCGVCASLRPALEEAVLKAEGGVRLATLDVDENPDIPGELNIRGVPTVYSYYQGHPVDGFVGPPQISALDFVARQADRVS